MVEKLRIISAQERPLSSRQLVAEVREAPRCIIAHKWTHETGLFERPEFPLLEFQTAIRHEVEFVHERGRNKTGGIIVTPEALAATTDRTFFLSTGLLSHLVLSPFDGDPQ